MKADPSPIPSTPYDAAFYAKAADEGLSSAQVVVPRVMELLSPTSAIDVGCGPGAWLGVFESAGVERTIGLEGAWLKDEQKLIDADRIITTDLAGDWTPPGERFDLALCLEVAEHLPYAASAGLVKRLTDLAPAVLFSAAIPGQQGTDHINEQWPSFWRRLFEARGYVRLDPIRRHIWQDERVAWYYQQNLYLFVHADLLTSNPALAEEHRVNQSSPLTLVHAGLIRPAMSFRSAFRVAFRQLGFAIGRMFHSSDDSTH
ncbi:MAG: hypothetical protein GC159_17020 [Phycisphaera sp.]|nr:hypothetical protein [Phycisphaera sp.]